MTLEVLSNLVFQESMILNTCDTLRAQQANRDVQCSFPRWWGSAGSPWGAGVSFQNPKQQHPSLSLARNRGWKESTLLFYCVFVFAFSENFQVKCELFQKCHYLSVYSYLEKLLALCLRFRQHQPVLGLPDDMNRKVGLCLLVWVVGQRAPNGESCDLTGVSAQPCTKRASTSAK